MTLSKWPALLRQCLLQRVSGEEFADLLAVTHKRSKISGPSLIHLIVKCKSSFCAPNDPLISLYLQKILSLGLADVSDVLFVLIKHWNEYTSSSNSELSIAKQVEDATSLVGSIIGMIMAGMILTAKETKNSLVLCSRWLASAATWISKDPSRASEVSPMAFVESCGLLLVALSSSTVGLSVLDQCKSSSVEEPSEPVASIQKSILSSIPLLPTASQSLHLRLEAVLRHVSQLKTNDNNETSLQDALNFQGRVIDGPSHASRASLYFYLDSLRWRCATIDDSRILSFLNARHSTDHATMFTELIIASFDVLQRSHSHERNQKSLHRWCSFVVNKLPALLSVISASSFGSFSTEDSLKTALQYVNPDFSSTYLTTNLSVVKTKFVQVCVLHRLLPSSDVAMVAGIPESDVSQSSALYSKDDLVAQIRSSHTKGAQILKEIRNLDGNAPSIASAFVEVIHGYCQSKETLPVKELVSASLKQPEIIDILSIYIQPGYLLSPLCRLLDAWTWDDLHGEGQPLYEEFGRILLFIAAFQCRLSLGESDLGLSNNSPFLLSFLQGNNDEQYLDSSTEDVKKHLGEWINALFIAEGLSDEVMSSCSAQDFYRLLPTLLSQSLTACESGKLSVDHLKMGFDYLREPFLLPSLIPAISWLTSPAAARHNQQHVQQLLQSMLKEPESIEAQEIRHAILGIAAAKFTTSSYGMVGSSNESVSELLSKFADFPLITSVDVSELRSWSELAGGAMSQIERSLHALLAWASGHSTTIGPPSSAYPYIAATLDLCGASFVQRGLARLLPKYYNTLDHAASIDLIATVIISLDDISPTTRVADALALEQQNLLVLLRENETVFAEDIVRLSRRVELLSVMVAQGEVPMDDVVTTLIPELTEADIQTVQAFPDQTSELPTTQENAPQDIDQMLDAAAAMGNLDQSSSNLNQSMDDIYLDLDTGDLDLLNFEDLDTEGMF